MTTTDNDSRKQQLHKYLNDTYGLLAQAEQDLVIASNLKERTRLRNKINEYEDYLEKWHEELTTLDTENAQDPDFSSPGAEVYLFGLARKSYALGSHDEALSLVEAVRKRNPYYPGLDTLEQTIRQANGTVKPRSQKPISSETSGKFSYPILLSVMVLLLVCVIVAILIVAQPNANNAARNNNNPALNAPRVTRTVALPPAPTDAPFLVPTPTVVGGASAPISNTAPPVPPSPTPTRR